MTKGDVLVGIVMGSRSDWPTMEAAAKVLDELGVPYEAEVVSAHRTPDKLMEYAECAEERGLRVIIAGAGGAAHLPGMIAAKTRLPVLGVPVKSEALNGLDSLLSIVQMPGGVPVATFAIGPAGAKNAGLFAVSILAFTDAELAGKLQAFRKAQTDAVLAHPDPPRMSSLSKPQVGVLGAGQLALMLAEAGQRIGISVICAGQPGDCAERVAPVMQVDLTSAADVAAFAARVDLVTVESENIDAAVLQGLDLYPNAYAIGIAQDRLLEKRFFEQCGIGVAPFAPVDTMDDLYRAIEGIGLPAILKTRRMGYDGKGQVRLQVKEEAATAWDEVQRVPCILEGMVPFETEVSLLAVRGRSGDMVFYPLVENFHRDGILRKSVAPFGRAELQAQAETYLRVLLQTLDYVGVLTVEFFVRGGVLCANEMAPRVHNSGHWTIEGSAASQFENHLRAIAGMPLGSTQSQPMVMLNCIGTMPAHNETQADTSLLRHDYGKEPRPGRKVGHLTFPASARAEIAKWQSRLEPQG